MRHSFNRLSFILGIISIKSSTHRQTGITTIRIKPTGLSSSPVVPKFLIKLDIKKKSTSTAKMTGFLFFYPWKDQLKCLFFDNSLGFGPQSSLCQAFFTKVFKRCGIATVVVVCPHGRSIFQNCRKYAV